MLTMKRNIGYQACNLDSYEYRAEAVAVALAGLPPVEQVWLES
jgi:hypothetical protein